MPTDEQLPHQPPSAPESDPQPASPDAVHSDTVAEEPLVTQPESAPPFQQDSGATMVSPPAVVAPPAQNAAATPSVAEMMAAASSPPMESVNADAGVTAGVEQPAADHSPTVSPAAAEIPGTVPEAPETPATEPSAVSEAAPSDVAEPLESGLPASAEPPQSKETLEVPEEDVQAAQQEVAATETHDRPAARIREKLGVHGADKPVGSEDIKTQRPEIPTNVVPVDIPTKDEDEALVASLEEEIASALGKEIEAQAAVAVPSAEESAPGTESSESSGEPSAPSNESEIGPGSKLSGVVQHIHGDDVFLNVGLRSDVVISLKQFPADEQPEVGASLSVVIDNVDDDGLLRARLPQARSKSGGNWDGLAVGQIVDCMVTGTNKGGLQVTVSNLKAFLPASQVDLGFVSSLEEYVGQKLTVQITEVKPKKRNLVVSRRAVLQAERDAQQADFWGSLEVGQDYSGTVKTIKNYGAFVNLGPIDGFLHIGEISWSRINHPNEVLKEGQEVQVRVLKIDPEKNRISLGMKQMIQNPWLGLSERYPSERIVSGKVTRVADFGAFVELEPGVEGLVHISELAWRRVGSVAEVLKFGDVKDFKVLEVDPKRKRVSLSLKALEQKPESVRKSEAEEEDRPVRKPNPDLRGGTGRNTGGSGLFGNPSDFS